MFSAFIGPGAFPQSRIAGLITTSQRETALLKGQAFTQSQVFTLSAGLILNFLIDPTGYVPEEDQIYGEIVFEVPSFSATGGPILIEFFTNPIFTLPGALVTPPPFNRDAGNPRTPQLSLTQAPTLTSPGTLLSQILLPATSTGVVGTPSSVSEALPFIFGEHALLMRTTNENGAGVRFNIRHNWYEV